jgi:hypothetical protein
VSELVELAERERADPTQAPDLMGLFSSEQRLAEGFTLVPGPRPEAKRKPRKATPRQLQIEQIEPTKRP